MSIGCQRFRAKSIARRIPRCICEQFRAHGCRLGDKSQCNEQKKNLSSPSLVWTLDVLRVCRQTMDHDHWLMKNERRQSLVSSVLKARVSHGSCDHWLDRELTMNGIYLFSGKMLSDSLNVNALSSLSTGLTPSIPISGHEQRTHTVLNCASDFYPRDIQEFLPLARSLFSR